MRISRKLGLTKGKGLVYAFCKQRCVTENSARLLVLVSERVFYLCRNEGAACQPFGVLCRSRQCSPVKTVPRICLRALICPRCGPCVQQLPLSQAFSSSEPASLRRFLCLRSSLAFFLRFLWYLLASSLAALQIGR